MIAASSFVNTMGALLDSPTTTPQVPEPAAGLTLWRPGWIDWKWDPGSAACRKGWGVLPDQIRRVNRVFIDYRSKTDGSGEVELALERGAVSEFPDMTFASWQQSEQMRDSWFQDDRIIYVQDKVLYWRQAWSASGSSFPVEWWDPIIFEVELVPQPIRATPTIPAPIKIVPGVKPGGKPPFVNGDILITDPNQPVFEGPIQFPTSDTPGSILPPTFVHFVTDQEIAKTTNLPTVKPARPRSFLDRMLARWRNKR
jgi:hypothetical protein